MQKQFELGAFSFSEFNMDYPNDSKLADSTLLLAKAVYGICIPRTSMSHICLLPELLDEKPQNFIDEMGSLHTN